MKTFSTRAMGMALATCACAVDANTELETVTVTGQALPAAITTLSNNELRPVRDTGDALRDLLGVGGSRMGGHGIDPAIRGLSQTQLNILLDGAYIHGGCPNRMDPPTSYAGASAWENVTVIRGTQTLEYGGGGPGGTIVFERNTQPLAANEPYRAAVNAFYRDNDAAGEVGADLTLGSAGSYLRFIGGHTSADDYRDGSGARVRSSYNESSGAVIIGHQFADDSLLEVAYDYQLTEDALFPGAGMDSPEAENRTTRLKYSMASVGPLSSLRFEAYQADVDHVMDNYSLRLNTGPRMRAPSTSDTVGGRFVATLHNSDLSWKFGINVQNNVRSARRWNDSGPSPTLNSALWPDVSIKQSGTFGEVERSLGHGYSLMAGLRYDRVRSEARGASIDPPGMPLSPNALYALYYEDASGEDRTDHNLGGLARLEFTRNDGQLGWYVGIAQSLRSPDATERFMAANGRRPSMRWVGNPDLRPEQHRQFEIGAIRQWTHLALDLSLYYNRVNDFVLRDRALLAGNNATIYRNVDAALAGGEAQLSWAINRNWRAQLGAAYVHGENRSDHRALAQIQPLEAFARLDWRTANWELTANIQSQANQRRVDLDSQTGISGQGLDVRATPGWGVLNLTALYHVTDQWSLQAGIDNAFDKDYSQHLNRANAFEPDQIQVNEPGRAIWIGIRGTL